MKKFLTLIILLISIAVFAACTFIPEPTATPSPSPPPDPIYENRHLANDFGADGNYGSDYFRNVGQRATLGTSVLDTFDNGARDDLWRLVDGHWMAGSTLPHEGVKSNNVFRTDDGTLAIRAVGDFHPDESIRRSGGALVSNDMYGPGRFEIRMQPVPREGVCTALWTFYNNGAGEGHVNEIWSEIDIEIVGGGAGESGFSEMWTTTWRRANQRWHEKQELPFIANNGDYNIYSFDWYTDYYGDGSNIRVIEWFVNGELLVSYRNQELVPNWAAKLWFGAWMPSWSGDNFNFDEAWMLIDWVKYTPFNNNPFEVDENYQVTYTLSAPSTAQTVVLPVSNNRLANSGFENWNFVENNLIGWTTIDFLTQGGGFALDTSDKHAGNSSLRLTSQIAIQQQITAVWPGYKFSFEAWAKASPGTTARIELWFLARGGGGLQGLTPITLNINSNEWGRYYIPEIIVPEGARWVSVRLISSSDGGNAWFDDVSFRFLDWT